MTRALEDRERAKAEGDYTGAAAAREQADVACSRLVEVVRKHLARGLSLDSFREALWGNWVPGTLQAVAIFEPVLERDSSAELARVERPSRKRIASGLSPIEKVAALVAKTGGEGATKTGLRRGMAPKPNAEELEVILDQLETDGRIETREVRIEVTGRRGTRYFLPRMLPDLDPSGRPVGQ